MIETDLGCVTAYADAVAQGYTGTREEFGQVLANFADSATQVAADRTAVEAAKASVEEMQSDVTQKQETVTSNMNTAVEATEKAKQSASNAEASKQAAAQSEQNINNTVTAFDDHVKEKKSEADTAINKMKDAAVQAVTDQQSTSVQTVKDQTASYIAEKETSAKTEIQTTGETAMSNLQAEAAKQQEYIKTSIDDTLSISGKAADAGATGEAIDGLKEDLTQLGKTLNYAKIDDIVGQKTGFGYCQKVTTQQWENNVCTVTAEENDAFVSIGSMSDKYLKSGRKYAVAFNLMSEVGCTLRTLTDYSFTQVIGSVGGAYSTNGTCIGGSGANAMWQDVRINALEKDIDCLLIMGGTNDSAQGVTIGEISRDNLDTSTFVGAYNVLLSKVYCKYYHLGTHEGITQTTETKPIQIMLATPIYCNDSAYGNMDNIAEAVRGIANMWGIPVADQHAKSGINAVTSELYLADKVHPNDEGGKRVANVWANALRENAELN